MKNIEYHAISLLRLLDKWTAGEVPKTINMRVLAKEMNLQLLQVNHVAGYLSDRGLLTVNIGGDLEITKSGIQFIRSSR